MGYTDSDWGGSETDGKNSIRGCFKLGSSMVSWMSRKQDTISLSSAEDEYVATSRVCHEEICLRKLLLDFFKGPINPTWIHFDNESCIRFMEDLVFLAKTKHINNK